MFNEFTDKNLVLKQVPAVTCKLGENQLKAKTDLNMEIRLKLKISVTTEPIGF